MEYSSEDIERAIEVLKQQVVSHQVPPTITYTELYLSVGFDRPANVAFLDPGFHRRFIAAIHRHLEDYSDKLPPLDSLIVYENDRWPGAEYFEAYGHIDPRGIATSVNALRQNAALGFWCDQVDVCRSWGNSQHKVKA